MLLHNLLSFSPCFLLFFSTISFSRSRSYSRSPFSRSPYSRSRSRSRSRSYSYSPSRSRSRSRSHGRFYPRSPYSRRNGRSYGRSRTRSRSRSRSYGYRRSGTPRSPPPYRPGAWEGAEGAGPYRSRSRSRSPGPGGFRTRSPGGRKPPPRELPPYELKGSSPGGNERWERERYRQWEKEYADWYNKYYKDYDNQHPHPHPPLHHRGHGSRDRERDRMSPLPRDYSPQGRGRRGREERGAPPHHPPSSSSGTKSSTKVLKTKKVKKKRSGEESESSHQSVDRGDATPVRDEPMDEIPSLVTTPPVSSKASLGAATSKAPASKSSAAPVKTSTKSTSKTPSDKTKKEKSQKVKARVKTEAVKVKTDRVKKKTGEGVVTKKDSSSSSSSSATKPLKTIKTKPEDAPNSTTPKKEKGKSSAVRPALLKTPPLSSQNLSLHHASLHDGPRPGHDMRGRRDLPQGCGLLPLPHQHALLHRPPSPDSRRRMGEEGRCLLGPPPGKLRRIDGLGGGGDLISHSHMSHQPPLHRLPPASDRPGLLPLPGSREMGRGDAERGSIRPLMDLQVGLSLVLAHL